MCASSYYMPTSYQIKRRRQNRPHRNRVRPALNLYTPRLQLPSCMHVMWKPQALFLESSIPARLVNKLNSEMLLTSFRDSRPDSRRTWTSRTYSQWAFSQNQGSQGRFFAYLVYICSGEGATMPTHMCMQMYVSTYIYIYIYICILRLPQNGPSVFIPCVLRRPLSPGSGPGKRLGPAPPRRPRAESGG